MSNTSNHQRRRPPICPRHGSCPADCPERRRPHPHDLLKLARAGSYRVDAIRALERSALAYEERRPHGLRACAAAPGITQAAVSNL